MNRTGKRRLLKLADLLVKDARKKTGIKFDLKIVAEASTRKAWEGKKKVPVDCGTAACALGLAAISGKFKRAGLSYTIEENMRSKFDLTGRSMFDLTVNGQIQYYDNAGAIVFGITQQEARFLFHPDHYPSDFIRGAKAELNVAKRIRDFANGKIEAT